MHPPNKIANHLSIQEVSWAKKSSQLTIVRSQVFIIEQQVPIALEWDDLDDSAIHLLALDADTPIGCARILRGGIIGRMAVLPAYRNQGVGHALLKSAIDICRCNSWNEIKISAQTHAITFYEKAGFVISSSEYMDAGIPHQDMVLHLSI